MAMKTLWVFVNSQLIMWCLGLTALYRFPEATFPDTFYQVAAASFFIGLYCFLKLNPRISELSSNDRITVLLIFRACLAYIPYIVPLIRARFQI